MCRRQYANDACNRGTAGKMSKKNFGKFKKKTLNTIALAIGTFVLVVPCFHTLSAVWILSTSKFKFESIFHTKFHLGNTFNF